MVSDAQKNKAQREAAYWVTLLEADHPTERDRLRFRQWLDADPLHKQAYGEISQLWRASGTLQQLADLEAPRTKGPPRDGHMFRGLVPAAVLTVVIAIGAFLVFRQEPAAVAQQTYVTVSAEMEHVALPDGSEVTLGPKSQLLVHFNDNQRRLSLKGGEAYFAVASDPLRPMLLQSGDVEIRVMGTAFNVHHGPRGLTITVAEGVVAVSSGANTGGKETSPLLQLEAGQQVTALSDGTLNPVAAVAAERVGAWRNGRLIYENSPLGEVVADANRYAAVPIVLASPTLADLPVMASFRTSQINEMVESLADLLPIVVDRSVPGRITLRARPGA